jgi:predicted ATPase/class 3 adenylate cyclase
MLWPDCSTSQGLSTLRRYLTDLRRALGPEAQRLGSPTSHSLTLDLTGAAVDVVAFDAAVARGNRESLEEAVALYRGPLLEEWTEEWVFEERQARGQRYLEALEELAADALARGDLGGAEGHLRRAVVVDPLRESAQRRLMEVLAAAGSYTAATEVYRELRLRLQRDLNGVPSAETRALYDTIRAEARRRAQAAPSPSLAAVAMAGGDRAHQQARDGSPSPVAGGTKTFLFTDVENSTRLWEQSPEGMRTALHRHDCLLRDALEAHDGHVFKTMGDQFCAAFESASQAVVAALEAQRALAVPTPGYPTLRVRMALHTGLVEERDGDYFGPPLNRIARLLEAGYGGQILLSLVTQELVREHLPEGACLRDLGEHRLRDLARAERIFQLLAPDLPTDFPPLKTLEARRQNLPVQRTPLIGREQEAAAAKAYLRAESAGVLTLTGPGGTGKTRLALQVVADLVEEFPEGVVFVDLAPITDPDLVASAVAQAVGVRQTGDRPLLECLRDSLREGQRLLLLDNFEQVLSAAPLIADLLAGAARLKLLVTSRAALRVRGEQEFPVAPLPVPAALDPNLAALRQYASVELFVQRAAAVKPDFTLAAENALAVAEICRRLEGLPLAIELAAARIKLLSPQALLSRLERRLPLLTGGAKDLPARQHTLRDTIAWSYDLLTEAEQWLFRRLSLFSVGCTLEAAEAVTCRAAVAACNPEADLGMEVLDGLASLVDKNLLQQPEDVEGEPRFSMFETIREFGLECLQAEGKTESLRERHAHYFLALAEAAEPELNGPAQLSWLDRLESEHDNFRAALGWCEEAGDAGRWPAAAEIGLRLVGALWWFWWKRSYYTEGRRRAEAALSRGGEAPAPARVKALLAAGMLAHFPGDYLGGDRCFEEALALARAAGYAWGEAFSLLGLAMSVILRMYATGSREERERAATLAEDAVAVARETGDKWLIAITLKSPGLVAELRGDHSRATVCFEEALALGREIGDAMTVADSLVHLARLADYQGDPERARACFQEGLVLCSRLEEKRDTMMCLAGLAELAAARQQAERAARLWGTVEALCEASHIPREASWHISHERNVAAVRAALGEGAFDAAWAEGKAMTLDQAIALALGTTDLA